MEPMNRRSGRSAAATAARSPHPKSGWRRLCREPVNESSRSCKGRTGTRCQERHCEVAVPSTPMSDRRCSQRTDATPFVAERITSTKAIGRSRSGPRRTGGHHLPEMDLQERPPTLRRPSRAWLRRYRASRARARIAPGHVRQDPSPRRLGAVRRSRGGARVPRLQLGP
jgi:hypothetical protein